MGASASSVPVRAFTPLCCICADKCLEAYSAEPSYEDGATQLVVSNYEDRLIFAFRGSDELEDWCCTNACITRESSEAIFDGRYAVHSGFLDAYLSVSDYVLDKIVTTASMRVVVTGHSLGGALATLCCAHLVTNGMTDVSLVCFGTPRLAYDDALYSEIIEGANVIEDVVHSRDPVVFLPMIPSCLSPRPTISSVSYVDVPPIAEQTDCCALRANAHSMTEYREFVRSHASL